MSRFFRANCRLQKLSGAARLIQAARHQNPGLSVARVANHLDYSSPQSFSPARAYDHEDVPSRFRSTYDGQGMLQLFRTDLVLPYVDVCAFILCCVSRRDAEEPPRDGPTHQALVICG